MMSRRSLICLTQAALFPPPPTQNVDDAITSFFRMLSARRLARNWTEKSSTREKRSSVLNVNKFFRSFSFPLLHSHSLSLSFTCFSSSYFRSVAVAACRCARGTVEKVTFWCSLWVMNSFNDPHPHSSSFCRDKFVSESNVQCCKKWENVCNFYPVFFAWILN